MRLESHTQFDAHAQRAAKAAGEVKKQVLICCGTGCLANGALEVAEAFKEQIAAKDLAVSVGLHTKRTGCHGFCERGPLVVVQPEGILYTKVQRKHVKKILQETVLDGEVIKSLLYKNPADKSVIEQYAEVPFYKHQTRVAMRNIGRIDPEDIDDAIAHGAYRAVVKALCEMTPEQVIEEVDKAGLRGRGGAGFSTARKWRSCVRAGGERRFVLCNGDEGDPGAFKDRSIMEGDPHAVLEGMIIGAYAVAAHEGFIYVRHEYPLAVTNLTKAIAQARDYGLLGSDILGTGFTFDIKIARGGGAFVCGESSALMRSVAGEVGEPHSKYVRSVEKGLYDLPTVLNNVETWADVGPIIADGADKFAAMGTEKSKGTKAFSLVGKVKNTGLIELPMGTTLRNIIYDIGGGIQGDRPFKAVQTGGPSGGCVPEKLLDLPVDYEQLTEAGSMMGSGGMIVMDDWTCVVDVARYFLKFLTDESCGKCVPCREGVRQLHDLLSEVCDGTAEPNVIDRIESLSNVIAKASLCGLGKSAPNPVLSTLQHFRDEYESHINDRKCPAGVCKALITFRVIDDKCPGCLICKRVCPMDAITGEKKVVHHIDPEICDRCGACRLACPFDAIEAV